MEKKYKALSLHQKMEMLIQEMVEKELLLKDAMKEFERIFIETASKKYQRNMTKVATALGIHRNTLHNRTKSLKIKK